MHKLAPRYRCPQCKEGGGPPRKHKQQRSDGAAIYTAQPQRAPKQPKLQSSTASPSTVSAPKREPAHKGSLSSLPSLGTPSPAPSSAPSGPIKNIPGYYWDAEKHRYFKGTAPVVAKPPPIVSALPKCPSVVSLLASRQCSSHSVAALRTTPLRHLQHVYAPLNVTGAMSWSVVKLNYENNRCSDIRPCPEQPDADKLIVALSFHGTSVWHLSWNKDAALLSAVAIAGEPADCPVSAVRWNPVNTRFVGMALFGNERYSGRSLIMELTAQPELRTRQVHAQRKGSVWTMEWHPAGDRYAVGRTAGGVVLDLQGSCVTTLKTFGSDVFATIFNASGTVVLHGDRQGVVRAHDLRASPRELRDGSHLPTMKLTSSTSCLQLLKDATYLVTGALQNEIAVWDRRMQRIVTSFAGHTCGLEHRPFSVDSAEQYLAAYGAEGTLRIWDVRCGGEPVAERSATPTRFGKRPQWVDHWGGPALLAADGQLRYWYVG